MCIRDRLYLNSNLWLCDYITTSNISRSMSISQKMGKGMYLSLIHISPIELYFSGSRNYEETDGWLNARPLDGYEHKVIRGMERQTIWAVSYTHLTSLQVHLLRE